ncbi:hypothetical protein V6N12_026753 [Hibiscus sabdariffa]|uniref:Uncharacterized protein n=1 Tax=Hibiscus sabdariffa TaxID=183260 RepID=A0ABR2DT27_9ROSI
MDMDGATTTKETKEETNWAEGGQEWWVPATCGVERGGAGAALCCVVCCTINERRRAELPMEEIVGFCCKMRVFLWNS